MAIRFKEFIWTGSLILCAVALWTGATEGLDIRKGGSLWARIESDGYIRIDGSLEGRFESDGAIRKNGSLIGKIEEDGMVRYSGSIIGQIESDGTLRKNGTIIGRIESDGTIRRDGSIWGSVSDSCENFDRKRAVAAVLIFFTKDFFKSFTALYGMNENGNFSGKNGGADETRTRDLRRDRPAF